MGSIRSCPGLSVDRSLALQGPEAPPARVMRAVRGTIALKFGVLKAGPATSRRRAARAG